MKKIYIILLVILLLVVVVGGYYAYTQYNVSKTQEILNSSYGFKNDATAYFKQAEDFESNGDYDNAINMYLKSHAEYRNASKTDKQALNHADGLYREYLDKDVEFLGTVLKLIEYKVYLNMFNNNTLNHGQEKVKPEMLIPYIDGLTRDAATLKKERDRIILENPDAFSFLNI